MDYLYVNLSGGSLKRPRSPASFEKSGLTQEMRNLDLADIQIGAKSRDGKGGILICPETCKQLEEDCKKATELISCDFCERWFQAKCVKLNNDNLKSGRWNCTMIGNKCPKISVENSRANNCLKIGRTQEPVRHTPQEQTQTKDC